MADREVIPNDLMTDIHIVNLIAHSEDPFGTAVAIIRLALNEALDNNGRMSDKEMEILKTVGRRLNTADDYLHVRAELLD